jgi:hypothetical protein
MTIRYIEQTITRPANGTPYTIGDTIKSEAVAGNMLPFGVEASVGKVVSAMIISSALPTTKLEADLLLFEADMSVTADNFAFSPTDTQVKNLVAIVPFLAASAVTLNVAANASYAVVSAVSNRVFRASSRVLYGVLVARNAYTPASGEVLSIRLGVETD